jgi:hypothetical protein
MMALLTLIGCALLALAPVRVLAEPPSECGAERGPGGSKAAALSGTGLPEGRPESIVFRASADLANGRVSIDNPLISYAIVRIDVSAEEGPVPSSIALVSNEGRRFTLERGPHASAASFALPSVPARCLALSWKASKTGRLNLTVHTSATPEALVRALSDRGDARLGAIALLPRMGVPAVDALEAAFPSMPARERRDALKVYARLAKEPRASARLVDAAVDEDPAVRRLAVEALEGDPLIEAASRGSREAWVKASIRAPERTLSLALDLLGEGPPYDDLRRALRDAADRLGAEAPRALVDALGERSATVRARAVEALVGKPALRPHLLAILRSILDEAVAPGEPLTDEAFERLYRAVRAARVYDRPSLAELWGPLTRLTQAHEWMLRAAAYEALASLGAAAEVLEPGLDDPYPRVRRAVLGAVAVAPGSLAFAERFRSAARDPWSSVRAHAITLAAQRDLLLGDVKDRSPRVRLAVVESWIGRDDLSRDLEKALGREKHLGVKGGFLAAATERCASGYDDTARAVLDAAQSHDGDAPHAAEALAYLLAFDGEARQAILAALRAHGARSPELDEPPRCARKNAL